jgi:hexulose-6-phosphate isomerase
MSADTPSLSRRHLLAAAPAAALVAIAARGATPARAADAAPVDTLIEPPAGKSILLSCKLGMIAGESGGKALSLVERLKMAADAGFDGVDLDQAGGITTSQARAAVRESGVFVHNAINHEHWGKRLTSPNPDDRATAVANLEHCLRVSHAAGGSGVALARRSGRRSP